MQATYINYTYTSRHSCSNQVAKDIGTKDKEQARLQTYNQISSTLASISSVAAAAVSPTLENITRNLSQNESQVEDSLKALAQLWEEVFGVLATEIANVINVKLEAAIMKVNTECENALNRITALSSHKRKASIEVSESMSGSVNGWRKQESSNKNDDFGSASDVDKRYSKRRRLLSTPSPNESIDQSCGDFDVDSGLNDIFQKIKTKMGKQAHSLALLNKENAQVCL